MTSRVVLVSGGGGGIGHAIALRLGLVGYRVAVCDIDEASSERTAAAVRSNGGDAHSFTVDVADEESVGRLIGAVVARFGRLDAAVNNAGVIGKAGFAKLEHWSADEFDLAMRVNARGVFLAMRAQLKQFRQQQAVEPPGAVDYAIVNVSSFVGLRAAPGQCGYGASKFAVTSLTQTAAVEYADKVRVNCVCPSIIDAGMGAMLPEISIELTKKNNPTKRPGTAFDVVNAIEFLLTARYVNGAALPVDGGQSAK